MKRWTRLGERVNGGLHGLLLRPYCMGDASCAGRTEDVSTLPG